ncbi:unnamed protein product, partial [Phaeothamnion confervicola]
NDRNPNAERLRATRDWTLKMASSTGLSARLKLTMLPFELSVCKLPPASAIPAWSLAGTLFSVTSTPYELSIVCATSQVIAEMQSVAGWCALKVEGSLDFSLVGILADLSSRLAIAAVSIFAISTYDTDYLLVKKDNAARAVAALREQHDVAWPEEETAS